MSDVVVVGVLSLLGTLVGSITGILTANRLTNYRIEQLEKKVSAHNCLVERMALQEQSMKTVWKRVDEAREEIEKIEDRLDRKGA